MVKLTNVHRHTVTDVLEGGLHTVECDITRLVQGLQNTWSSKTTSTAVGSDCAVKKAREEITYAHLARRVNFVNTFLEYNRLGSIAEITAAREGRRCERRGYQRSDSAWLCRLKRV